MIEGWDHLNEARRVEVLRNLIDENLHFFGPMDAIDVSFRITLAQSALPTASLQLEFLKLVSSMLDKKMSAKSIIRNIDRIDFSQTPLTVPRPVSFGDIIRILILALLFGAALLAIYKGWK